jgi:nucleoporin NDC1
MLSRASTAILSPEKKQKLLGVSQELRLLTGPPENRSSSLAKTFPYVAHTLRSWVGQPFRQTYERRLRKIVLGAPHGELCLIIDAIRSLTHLLTASLAEDQYGKVQTDVPVVIGLLAETITALESFVNSGLEIHWTDVYFPPSSNPEAQAQARRIPEVDTILNVLKMSLQELLAAFQPYFCDVGLVDKDLRLAKKAASIVGETSTSAS